MPKYRVLVTQTIVNSGYVELEADNIEAVRVRIEDENDYFDDALEPQTLESFVAAIEEVQS